MLVFSATWLSQGFFETYYGAEGFGKAKKNVFSKSVHDLLKPAEHQVKDKKKADRKQSYGLCDT